MNKCYIDGGTNSMGGYRKLVPILGIDDNFEKIFVEPNPENYDGVYDTIDEKIRKIPNSILLRMALAPEAKEYELLTRSDMKGDSAATLLGEDFINTSIGLVNQKNPETISYHLKQGKSPDEIFDYYNKKNSV